MQLTTQKLNWKLVMQLPERNMKLLAKQVKSDLQGVMIKDKNLYITDAFYAFTRPFEHPNGFISAIDGKQSDTADLTLADTLQTMFQENARNRYTPDFTMSVDLLKKVLAIAELQNKNWTFMCRKEILNHYY